MGTVRTLEQLEVGTLGQITGIQADVDLTQRFAALGLRAGCPVQVLRKASFGGPLHVRVGTTEVIMRLQEASRILAVPSAELFQATSTG
jgi:ferrous iron transport protein A